MSILQVSSLTKYFGSKLVFEDLSFEIADSDRVALVGPNGSGKTTLLNIITGQTEPDDGSVYITSNTTIGYLEQNKDFNLSVPLWDFLSEPLEPLFNCERELFELSQMVPQLAGKELEQALEKYNRLQVWYEVEEGYTARSRLNMVYNGLGFSETDKHRTVSSFSGGERTRIELARKLLEKPRLLILDEPTNHLDADTVQWLEEFLKSYPHAFLVVSHDRYFLDEIAQKVLYLESGSIKMYRGNYSDFKKQREQEEKDLERAYTLQQAYIKKERELIDGARETEKAQRFAKSREKRLEKLEFIERPKSRETLKFQFPFVGRSGNIALRAEGLSFSYSGSRTIVEDASFTIKYGDRVALVGPNGAGKTTLFRLILGELRPDGGHVGFGASVEVSYFSQVHSFKDEENTVLDELIAYKHMTLGRARDHLAKFLFKGDDVLKKVGSLSGGEKSRLILAKMALTSGNFLLLDEPTNHLDIESLETLEEAMLEYPGTILFISHDRYLVSKVAQKIMEIQEGTLTLYPFGYRDYLLAKKNKPSEAQEKTQKPKEAKQPSASRLSPKRLEREKAKVLEEIHLLEEEKTKAQEGLKDEKNADDWEKLAALQDEIAQIDSKLSELYEVWLELEEASS